MNKKYIIIIISIFFLCFPGFPQESEETIPEELPGGPKGYRGIEIGMPIDKVKELLLKDPYFDYKGDPDISFLPVTQQALIECSGNLFIDRVYFQFHEVKLFIMIIELNQTKLDYYTMFTTLTKKYGESSYLDPSEAVWNFSDIRLSIEKPLRVKYIDSKLFEKLKDAGKAEKSLEDLSRDEFLKDF
jgi:hypothetical protein